MWVCHVLPTRSECARYHSRSDALGCRNRRAPASKFKLQRKLNRAWSANLIERIQTTICAAGPQAVRQCLRRLTEQGACQVVGRTAKVRMIEDVEELSSEPKSNALSQVKLPLQSKI